MPICRLVICGSSPLARGTPPYPVISCGSGRFIPARAGNTRPLRGIRQSRAVHPRSRGEHIQGGDDRQARRGSSPLARGTLDGFLVGDFFLRFIPARAGNTSMSLSAHAGISVHPRSRGEHTGRTGPFLVVVGSSPLARGTLMGSSLKMQAMAVHPRSRGEHAGVVVAAIWATGSSPLARGTRRPLPPGWRQCAVHPRSRGEHAEFVDWAGSAFGSSPLARGTRAIAGCHDHARRFIPARAGNTFSGWSKMTLRPVHPRSRGEHHNCDPGRTKRVRFIPARAGNTHRPSLTRRSGTVHPRSRGEHLTTAEQMLPVLGSSPLARGTLPRRWPRSSSTRFIPARAGNTSPE